MAMIFAYSLIQLAGSGLLIFISWAFMATLNTEEAQNKAVNWSLESGVEY